LQRSRCSSARCTAVPHLPCSGPASPFTRRDRRIRGRAGPNERQQPGFDQTGLSPERATGTHGVRPGL
jgi:hypothetical protein